MKYEIKVIYIIIVLAETYNQLNIHTITPCFYMKLDCLIVTGFQWNSFSFFWNYDDNKTSKKAVIYSNNLLTLNTDNDLHLSRFSKWKNCRATLHQIKGKYSNNYTYDSNRHYSKWIHQWNLLSKQYPCIRYDKKLYVATTVY
jgi:hypothetical protein